MTARSLVLYALITAAIAGVTLDVLAFLVARYGPVGDGWSFRGNGALVVPFGLGPAVLAAGWSLLAAHARGSPRWRAAGLMAGIVGALPVVAGAVALMVFGTAALRISDALTLLSFVWPIVALALAAALPTRATASRAPSAIVHVVAGVVLTLALPLAFLASELLLPPGS